MDKFGIFSLLSSLAGQLNKEDRTQKKTTDETFSAEKTTDERSYAEKRAQLPPLQSSMLSAMKNHEEFVKRVMQGKKN